MSEGELKKRMHAQRFAGVTSPQQIWLSEADKILDEARKEFPEIPESPDDPSLAERIIYSNKCLESKKKKKKWLGSGVEQK